jgi:radical SAM protein with 4Fe4S-binding SPASM domain
MISRSEFLRFLDVLTIRKLVNFSLTYASFYLSRIWGKPILLHRPFTISFEPTTQCNLGCPECPSGLKIFSRDTGNATLDLYEKLLSDTKADLLFVYLYFQGEPFIHKGFCEMVSIAKKHKIYTITSTNGHYLTPSKCEEIVHAGLDRILISIDGSTQEVYEQYRIHGKLDKVIEGTKNLVAAKKKLGVSHPEIVFQMLVVKPNEHQILEVDRLGKELGVDKLVLKTAQVYDFEHGNPLIPTIDQYSRYKKMPNGRWKIKNELKNQCWKLWHSAVSTWDGRIIPCCFDKDAKYTMGNVQSESFHAIWSNDKYRDFRSRILQSRDQIDICQNCSEGTKVWETVG